MSREMSIILLGIWVIIVPYLGIPDGWRTALIVLAGIAIVTIGLLLRGETLSRGAGKKEHRTFVENATPHSSQEEIV